MFQESTKLIINDAIEEELEAAITNYGDYYSTPHEAYAVLKEEIEETSEKVTRMFNNLKLLWDAVKKDKESEIATKAKHIQTAAYYCALEAAQVAAVAKKVQRTFSEEEK